MKLLREILKTVFVGISVGIITDAVLLAIFNLENLCFGIIREKPFLLVVFPPVGALMVSIPIWKRNLREAHAWGPGLDITAEEILNDKFPPMPGRSLLLKAFAQIIGIGLCNSGGLVGPAGRIGHLFSCFIFKRMNPRLSLMAISAGIGAVLKAPFGAGIFSVEAIYGKKLYTGKVSLEDLIYAEGAGILGALVSLVVFGDIPIFGLNHYTPALRDYALFPLLGLMGGITSYLFVRYYEKIEKLRKRTSIQRKFLLPVMASAIIAFTAWGLLNITDGKLFSIKPSHISIKSDYENNNLFPNFLGYGLENVLIAKEMKIHNKMAQIPFGGKEENFPLIILALIMLATAGGKIIANGTYVGAGGSGGMIGPALITGALTGGGLFLILYQLGIAHPAQKKLFIALTATSTLAGTVSAPIGCAIFAFELFGLSPFGPALISTFIADLLTDSYLRKKREEL
ncbi:MAG: chloride channel protein [Synergistetes bacterium]|nr:chloride channel protein [Synergistota bacterium]